MGNTHVVIRVQNRHISAGLGATPQSCAVALALFEQLNIREACVGARYFWLKDREGYMTGDIPLPDSAQRFISKFDDGQDVKPFEFRVEVPEAVLRG